ncbi:TfoX/Sxy family protein [Naumannella sp. ID2617S]|nr:TfoX/Sxy family protein [Naumannella sp. ID2617S]
MAYDEELAERIRAAVSEEPNVTELKMFGGLAFLINGNMAACAANAGTLMLRVPPDSGGELAEQPGVEPVEMQGRLMTGWLYVSPDLLETEESLGRWLQLGVEYARSLPPKVRKPGSRARR